MFPQIDTSTRQQYYEQEVGWTVTKSSDIYGKVLKTYHNNTTLIYFIFFLTPFGTFCHVSTLNINKMTLSGDKCHKSEVVEYSCFPPLLLYEVDHGKTLTKAKRRSELIHCSTFLRDHVPSSTQHRFYNTLHDFCVTY